MPKKTQTERYVLDGVTYTVDTQTKLGSGAEGMVIMHPTDPRACIKLFHPPEPGDQDELATATFRSNKVKAILASHPSLPAHFMLPAAGVYGTSSRRQLIGYQMGRVPAGYHKLKALTASSFRTGHDMGLRAIVNLYADLFGDLSLIHTSNLVVGDINLGCIMFEPGKGRAWVDTDSWSYPGYPGLATTELFAHPDLYSNLDPSIKRAVSPKALHDRFSLTVMLTMMAVPGAHPFRTGQHPTVQGLQNRTKAGITIFDSGVKSMGIIPEVLSDDLLQQLIERLKRRDDSPLDPDMLRTFASEVAVCSTCKTEYHSSRRACPKCKQTTTVNLQALVSYVIEELFRTHGTLLFAQMLGTDLYLVCRIGKTARVIRVDAGGSATTLSPALPNMPGARYRFFADCLAVCSEPAKATEIATIQAYSLHGETLSPLASTTTGILAGEGAVFDTSMRYLYRMAGSALLRTEPFGSSGTLIDTQIGTVHQQQSWFTADHSSGADREVVLGYDRAFRVREWFIISSDAAGSPRYYPLGDLGLRTNETVEDFAVYFSARSVLLAMQTKLLGRDYARYVVIGLDGKVLLDKLIDANDPTYQYWSNVRGKLHQGASILHTTAGGIVKQALESGVCTTLQDTLGVVTDDDRLLRMPGRVGIVRRSGISTFRKK